jgi:hypothetical protein
VSFYCPWSGCARRQRSFHIHLGKLPSGRQIPILGMWLSRTGLPVCGNVLRTLPAAPNPYTIVAGHRCARPPNPGGMNDLERQASHIRALGQHVATAERRAEVMAALASKWEGVQSVALDALGAWGGPDSLTAVRSFLGETFDRDAGWAIRGVAIRNLIPMVTAEDTDWVLDMYFKRPTALGKHDCCNSCSRCRRSRLVCGLSRNWRARIR